MLIVENGFFFGIVEKVEESLFYNYNYYSTTNFCFLDWIEVQGVRIIGVFEIVCVF